MTHLKLAMMCLVALCVAPARDPAFADPALPGLESPEVVPMGNLKYPGDCDSKTLRRAAEKGSCKVESGGEHLRVFKNGKLITTIPHSVKENGTCRSIIKAINSNC
jgi:hypothetical protein